MARIRSMDLHQENSHRLFYGLMLCLDYSRIICYYFGVNLETVCHDYLIINHPTLSKSGGGWLVYETTNLANLVNAGNFGGDAAMVRYMY